MNIVSSPVQQLPEAQSVTNDDYILTFNASDGKAHKALAALFHFGTTDYDALSHKPSINGEALSGNKTAADLGLVASAEGKGLSTNDFTDTEKSKLSGIEEQANKTLIDDTLSNAGQAADAKATGDAFSVLQAENALLKELINGIDAPIYRTASGNPATFSDGYAADVKELIVTLAPTQSGSGDPSPDNIRPISGVSSVTVTRTGENGANAQSVAVSTGDVGTVYGGALNVTTGVLTVTHGNIASYNGEALPGIWMSDRDVYAAGTSPTTGAQVVYELAAPVAYTLTPAQIAALSGYNSVSADAGTPSVTYRADPSISLGSG